MATPAPQPVDQVNDVELPETLTRCPVGVQRKIAHLLPSPAKKNLRATCSSLRDAVDQEVKHLRIDSAFADNAPFLSLYRDACVGADGKPVDFSSYQTATTIVPPFLRGVLITHFPCLSSIAMNFCFSTHQLLQACTPIATRLTSLDLSSFHLETTNADVTLLTATLPHLHALTIPFRCDSIWPPPSLAPLTALSSLSSLTIDFGLNRTDSDPNRIIDLSQHLPHLPHLRNLSIVAIQLPLYDPGQNPFRDLPTALPALRALTLLHVFLTYGECDILLDAVGTPDHLSVHSQDFSPLTTLTALHTNDIRYHTLRSIASLPHLAALTFDPCFQDYANSSWFRGFPSLARNHWRTLPAGTLPTLTALTLPADLLPATPTPFTNLTALTITPAACTKDYSRAVPVLAALLAGAPYPTLRHLDVAARATDPAPTLASLLAALPSVTDLRLSHNNWSQDLLDPLQAAACPTLRQLELQGMTPERDAVLTRSLEALAASLPHVRPIRWSIRAKGEAGDAVVVKHSTDGELIPSSRTDVLEEGVGALDLDAEEVEEPEEGDGELYYDDYGNAVMAYYDAQEGRYLYADYHGDDDYGDDVYADDDGVPFDEDYPN